uniref:Uncharacterized protein n=1 Tax=Anguilla anguilla TaxID=7936 RepID=A0A0E9PCS1_ANGAN
MEDFKRVQNVKGNQLKMGDLEELFGNTHTWQQFTNYLLALAL